MSRPNPEFWCVQNLNLPTVKIKTCWMPWRIHSHWTTNNNWYRYLFVCLWSGGGDAECWVGAVGGGRGHQRHRGRQGGLGAWFSYWSWRLCDQCKYLYTYGWKFRVHINCLECQICNDALRFSAKFRNHKRRMHRNCQVMAGFPTRGKEFPSRQNGWRSQSRWKFLPMGWKSNYDLFQDLNWAEDTVHR